MAERLVDATARKHFQVDGVVHLPGAFEQRWLEFLGHGMERDLDSPGPRFETRTTDDSSARYCENFWAWSDIPEFRDFIHQSPAASLAAGLLDATRINLVMDNWFLREAGATARAPWHHDIAYFDFEGSMCVLWLPLEAVAEDEGISFVRGSHLWGKLFQRVYFSNHETAGDGGLINGLHYEAPPDINADPDAFDLVSFACQPGDAIFFDMRTLHGSLSSVVPSTDQRRFTLRMTAENGRIRYRGDWAKAERALFEAAGYGNGDIIDGDFFPTLWP